VVATGLNQQDRNRYGAYDMALNLIVGDRHVRGAAMATRGDGQSPGVFELLMAARVRLHNKRIISGWAPLSLVREGPLVYAPKQKICIYTAVYGTKTVK
jgi:hypothetical protein